MKANIKFKTPKIDPIVTNRRFAHVNNVKHTLLII